MTKSYPTDQPKLYKKRSTLSVIQRVIPPVFLLLFASILIMADDSIPATYVDEAISDTIEPGQEAEVFIIGEEVGLEEPSYVTGVYTKQQLRRGERLFHGLTPFKSGLHNCASCHYTQPQPDINWNPGAHELARVWKEDTTYNLLGIMNNPMSVRLVTDHAGMTITEEEAHLLEAYYENLLKKGPSTLQAYPVRAAIFWGLGVLMLLAIIDLLFTRKIPFKALHILVLMVGLGVHGLFAMQEAQALGRTEGYAPDQPIKFSHLIHAGENKIDCRYCHFTPDYSLSANIPSNNTCLNCHNVIRNGTNSGAFEINKIHKAAESGKPVEWIRIHNLPNHTFFRHQQHVKAANLECQDCHGEVETMHILKQVEDLSMGWCLTCHRDTNVDFMDNAYFEIYTKLRQKIEKGEIEGVTAADLGGEDCMSCHY